MLEYALDSEADRTAKMARSTYQAFRTQSRWDDVVTGHGFVIDHVSPVPHPISSPSPGYLAFQCSVMTRLVTRLRLDRLAPALARISHHMSESSRFGGNWGRDRRTFELDGSEAAFSWG